MLESWNMKKLLAIVVIGLLWSGNAKALLGSKELIKFYECYPVPDYKNYKSFKNSTDNSFDEWSLEFNLKKNTLTRTVIWDDATIKSSKARGHDLKKLDVETTPIISATSELIVTIDGDWEYTSNIKTGYIQIFNKKFKKSYGGKQCKIN